MKIINCICLLFTFFACLTTQAQKPPKIFYTVDINGADTMYTFILPEVVCFSPLKFKNEKERLAYTKLVRDVKKTLPYAQKVSESIVESYQMMKTYKSDKERQKFLEDVQKYMMDEYKPKMKKMTRNQGKILVKLIDRETNSSSYEIVKSLIGPFKAGFYNTFAKVFGNNLKTRYEPEGKDWMIERIAIEIEQGNL